MPRRYLAGATLGAVGSLALRMPIYEYRCPKGHTFERFQSMTAPAPEKCDVCGASPVEIVLYPVAVHYKGSGFYSTDYGKKGKAAAKKDGGEGGSSSGDSSSSDSGTKSGSGSTTKSDSTSTTSKPEKKSSSSD
jgi:putative FmdB family regulatory protein